MAAYFLKKLVDPEDPDEAWYVIFEHGRVQKPDLMLSEYDMQALIKTYNEQNKKNGT